MSTIPDAFELPNSPSQTCLDRFSILDLEEDEDGLVPFWPLLVEIIKQPVTSTAQLLDVLDTIANISRDSTGDAGDYGTLKAVVDQAGARFFSHLWPKIVQLILNTPDYFPNGILMVLKPGRKLSLSRGQAACLVAHQFLCSLQCPLWRDGYFDFSIWYASEQRHPKAVDMYFAALFGYLEGLAEPEELLQQSKEGGKDMTTYSLHAAPPDIPPFKSWSIFKPSPIEIIQVDKFSTEQQERNYQCSHGAVVVSANKHIGFGQSATQEEIFVSNCPESCPAVLVTPPLDDSQVLVVEGASPMLRITGQRRDISWTSLNPASKRGGRMLFMDALEIDEAEESEELPDLLPGNIEREITKAYTAFSSWHATAAKVWAGVWGCGAFNGDPPVKMTILWVAASLAGKELQIICDPLHGDLLAKFSQFVEHVPASWTVQDLRGLLGRIPKDTKRLATMQAIHDLLKQG